MEPSFERLTLFEMRFQGIPSSADAHGASQLQQARVS